jgi:hypothetical protein
MWGDWRTCGRQSPHTDNVKFQGNNTVSTGRKTFRLLDRRYGLLGCPFECIERVGSIISCT